MVVAEEAVIGVGVLGPSALMPCLVLGRDSSDEW